MARPVVRRINGVLFLGVLAGLVGLSVALYQKAFTPVVEVTLQAGRAGNQLSPPADVKLRGLVVGEVREVRTTGDGAELRLALDPDQTRLIPTDVAARLSPKTLFGEKYVELVLPERSTGRPIAEGDVISADRTTTALETEKVLDDLLPLLRTLRPEQLNATLGALAGALRGRGDRLGDNLERVDAYFAGLNPELPALQRDLAGLADLADSYDDAAPDLLRFLDDTAATARTLTGQERQLAGFLTATTRAAGTADEVLRENAERLVALASASRSPLELFAAYSPEFPCIARALAEQNDIIGETFGGRQPGLHITLEATRDNGPYVPGEEPDYADTRPASCDLLPRPPRPMPDENFRDGYRDDRASTLSRAVAVAGRPGLVELLVGPLAAGGAR